MTPAYQTKLPPQHKVGNCLAAVVASLLDLPIDEVPNFEVLGEGDLWKKVLTGFLDQYKFFVEPSRELLAFCCNRGVWPLGFENVPYICYGEAMGVPHVVIMANDKLVHDPTPKAAGLDVISEVWVLRHKLNGLGGLHRGNLLKLDHIDYSPVPEVPSY